MARVLIVDDTDIVRRALELAVRKMGHQPESPSSAREALRLALARPPDGALLDYRMPEMDGLMLLTAMQDGLGERCPPVVFVSATPPEEMGAGPRPELPAPRHVKKPFHLDDLKRAVTDALAG